MDYKSINDYELVYRIRENNDDDAIEMMIKKYEPIICSYAKKYIKFASQHGVEFDDLIQEGRMAVVKAVYKYDSDKASIFYTYVSLCIERRLITYCRDLSVKKNLPLDYSINSDYLYGVIDMAGEPFIYVMERELEEKILLWVRKKFDFIDSSIFELRYNGFSYKEIGILLDVSETLVDSRLCKIRKSLQKVRNKL